jgi:3-hydroxyisobutyrate dehydrogenase-like beta-hydroxyacid dehydrogenase
MGSSMALNLRAAGYDMVVNDIRREAGAAHLQAGASWADSVRKVAEAADVVFTSLPGPAKSNRWRLRRMRDLKGTGYFSGRSTENVFA